MNDVIKSINVGGVEYDIQAKELTKVTYAELKELRDNGGLVAGHLYRITDYEFTTVTAGSKSAGHVFDIIVLALSGNELSHQARATHHEGDDYFVNNDLGAWELWYDFDNDTSKYEWADATHGKGVIYRLIDEFENDCPYDFKNLLVYSGSKYYYTIHFGDNDGSLRQAKRNKIAPYGLYSSEKYKLGFNTLDAGHGLIGVILHPECYNNKIGSDAHFSVLGAGCNNNRMDGSYSILGDGCSYCNVNRSYTTLGNNCDSCSLYGRANIGDNCSKISIVSAAGYLTNIGSGSSSISISYQDSDIIIGCGCFNIDLANLYGPTGFVVKIGDNCSNITYDYAKSLTHEVVFEDGCSNIVFAEVGYPVTYKADGTVISKKEEYHDDGSGQLVPTKHPDLSTQPSILPYKFMGQYVYEQLIPKSELATYLASDFFEVSPDKILFLEVTPVTSSKASSKVYSFHLTSDSQYFLTANGERDVNFSFPYLRVVYTSMPDENGGYYYGGDELALPTTGVLIEYRYNDIDNIRGFSIEGRSLVSTHIGGNYWHINVLPSALDVNFYLLPYTYDGNKAQASSWDTYNPDGSRFAYGSRDANGRYYVSVETNEDFVLIRLW